MFVKYVLRYCQCLCLALSGEYPWTYVFLVESWGFGRVNLDMHGECRDILVEWRLQ